MKLFTAKSTVKLIALASLCLPLIANAQNVVKNINGPSDNPPYAAIKPYWIDRPVIEVIGRAKVQFDPNRVGMNFTIQEINENADIGLAKLTKRTKPVLEKIKAMLGKDDSISVSYRRQAIYQQYKDKDGNRIENQREDKIENYVLYWDIAITTQKFEIAPRLKAEILAIGNARMNGTEYYSFAPTSAQSREIFKAAVQDGNERAKLVSSLNNNKLKLLVVQEGQDQCLSSPTTQIGNSYPQENYAEARAVSMPMMAAPAPPPPVANGIVLQADDLIMPAAPAKHSMEANVCMVFAID
jgi:uncharacterized protein